MPEKSHGFVGLFKELTPLRGYGMRDAKEVRSKAAARNTAGNETKNKN